VVRCLEVPKSLLLWWCCLGGGDADGEALAEALSTGTGGHAGLVGARKLGDTRALTAMTNSNSLSAHR